MDAKTRTILSLVLAVLVVGFLWWKYRIEPSQYDAAPLQSPFSGEQDISEEISNTLQNPAEKLPESNPFENKETNPFSDAYRNPFK